MRRRHAIAISALLALAGIAGTVALAKTVALGQASPTPTASELHARAASLERAEAQLRSVRDRMPPALPPLPRAPAAGSTAPPAQSPAGLASQLSGTPFALERDDDEYAEHEHGYEQGDDHDDEPEHEDD